MDDKNLEILTLLRQGIPLVSMPWKELGDKLWIDEMSVISRIASMLQQGLIRYLGPFFDSRRLGYHGMLVGVEVPADRIPAVANVIQHESGVTHNYLRDGSPNMWFTLVTRNDDERQAALARVQRAAGCERMVLAPSKRLFKLRTDLAAAAPDQVATVRAVTEPAELGDHDRALIRTLQDGLKLERQPYARAGMAVGMSEADVLARLAAWLDDGVIRRIGISMHPERAGRSCSALVLWRVPADDLERVGRQLATFPEISHCYDREVSPEWPYSLYTMIHAVDRAALDTLLGRMVTETGLQPPLVLPTVRELKKVAMRYFEDDRSGVSGV